MKTRQLNVLIFCLARLAWLIIHCHKRDYNCAENHARLIGESMQPLPPNED